MIMEKKDRIQFLTITAMGIALTYVFTAFVNVRLPIAANGGLIHLGNVALFILAMLFVFGIISLMIYEFYRDNKS